MVSGDLMVLTGAVHGQRDARIYAVQYMGNQGVPRSATCKTSLLSGVYWTGGVM